jgi:hypothetical protein
MRALHRQIAPQMRANHTRILRGPHITAILEDWLSGRRGKESRTESLAEKELKAA